MVISLNRDLKTQTKDAIGVVEERAGKVLGKIDLERQGKKHQAEAKVESAAHKVEDSIDSARSKVAGALDSAGDRLRP